MLTVGEYMDAKEGEYEEEIAEFKKRNENIEYVIQSQISKFLILRYKAVSVLKVEKDSEMDLDTTINLKGEDVTYEERFYFCANAADD